MTSYSSPALDDFYQKNQLVNSSEAARVLSVSERTLWTLKESGELPHVKIRAAVRYDRNDLQIWIEEHKQRNGSNKRTPEAATPEVQNIKTGRFNKGYCNE